MEFNPNSPISLLYMRFVRFADDSDRVRSVAFQSSVGPVYFKDLLGKSQVYPHTLSDCPIEMGLAQIKLKLGRFPFQCVVTLTSRLIGGPGVATPLTGIEQIWCH